jgi:hypothetical protein
MGAKWIRRWEVAHLLPEWQLGGDSHGVDHGDSGFTGDRCTAADVSALSCDLLTCMSMDKPRARKRMT